MTKTDPHRAVKHWTIDVHIDGHDDRTRAKAALHWRDRECVGVGLARRNPADRAVTEIGDELALARALTDLASKLLAVTKHDIEAVTGEPVTSLY